MPSQNPQHSVAIAHGGSAGDGLIAGIGVAYKGDRFKAGRERSALVSPPASAGAEPWCPSSRATWEGVHRCASCLEPGACITEKSELSVTLIASLGKTVIWSQTKWGIFPSSFRRKVTLSISWCF